jgi:hypothetical protein
LALVAEVGLRSKTITGGGGGGVVDVLAADNRLIGQ